MQLAGHGKDERLIQTELLLSPNVGDRIREDMNSKEWTHKVDHLIREGVFVESSEYFGSTVWKVKLDSGKIVKFCPDDCEIIERAIAPVSVEEAIVEPLPEQTTKPKAKRKPSLPKGIKEAVPEQGFKVGDRVDSMHSGKNLEIVEILTRGFVVCRNADGQTFGINSSVLTKVQIDSLPEQSFKVGDRIKDKDGFIGVITSISDRCINAENSQSIKSWNLEELKGCLPISIYLGESERSPLQPETQAKSTPSPISTSIKTRKKSTKRTSQMSQSIATSETIPPVEELTCLQGDSPVLEHRSQENVTGFATQNQTFGTNTSGALTREDLDSRSSKTQQGYLTANSISEWVKSSRTFPKSGTWENGQFYPRDTLDRPKLEKGCLSLPTLTTGIGSKRNAGATSCETWLKDKKHQFIQPTQALSIEMMCLLFGFPIAWVECLSDAPKERLGEQQPESSLGEQSTSTAHQSQSNESSICIEFSANSLDASSSDRLQFLLEQKQKLIASGATPEGIWINCGKIPKRKFEQAVWKSKNPRPEWGDKKSKYIGERGKEAHILAIAQHKAGQELRKVEREIKKLQQVKA